MTPSGYWRTRVRDERAAALRDRAADVGYLIFVVLICCGGFALGLYRLSPGGLAMWPLGVLDALFCVACGVWAWRNRDAFAKE